MSEEPKMHPVFGVPLGPNARELLGGPISQRKLTLAMSLGLAAAQAKVHRLGETIKRLQKDGFPGAALVQAFSMLEYVGHRMILGAFLAAFSDTLTAEQEWHQYEDLATSVTESIFGRNGKIENLRAFLKLVVGDPFTGPTWQMLDEARKLRNKIVHEAFEPGPSQANAAADATLDALIAIVELILQAAKTEQSSEEP